MAWDIDNNRHIYLQLVEHIQYDILTGVYQVGEQLPSVRDLAEGAGVNPNTMQKALRELTNMGYIY